MLLPRTNKVYYKKGYRPALTLPKWKSLFSELGLGDETILDLRSQPSEEIIKGLYPMVNNPGKGVYLEYDLTSNPDLYDKVFQLIGVYTTISNQGAQMLAQTFEYGAEVSPSTLSTNGQLNLDYFQNEANSLSNTLDYYGEFVETATKGNSSIGPNVIAAKEIIYYSMAKFLDRPSTFLEAHGMPGSVPSKDYERLNYMMDSKDNADYALGFLKKTVDIFVDYARLTVSEYLSDPKTTEDVTCPETIDKTLKDLDALTYEDSKDTTRERKKILTIRLYPATASLMYGNPQVGVSQLSHNRFLTTKVKTTNLVIQLGNVVMLNTEDTQWFRFYSQLFTHLVNYGNPEFSIVVGVNKIHSCSLAKIPKFVDNSRTLELAGFTIISSKDGLNFEEA